MKNILPALFTLLILTQSCSKQTGPTTEAQKLTAKNYNESYQVWLGFKASANNSYKYTVVTASFAGFGTETILTIANGKITNRDYTRYTYEAAPGGTTSVKVIQTEWHENASNLNAHPNEGAEILTLDEVYTKAKNVWLKADVTQNDVFFEASNNGLISAAGYSAKGCMDDCFNGIYISSISKL